MTVKVALCDRCGKPALTGNMACTGEQLCASCAAKQFNVTIQEAEQNLLKQAHDDPKDIIAQIEELTNGLI